MHTILDCSAARLDMMEMAAVIIRNIKRAKLQSNHDQYHAN